MCRNHSHVRVNEAQGAILPDGSVVSIAVLDEEKVALENPQTGATYQPPLAGILLLLSPAPGMVSYSLDQWMAGFSALLFVMATIGIEDGGEMLLTLELP